MHTPLVDTTSQENLIKVAHPDRRQFLQASGQGLLALFLASLALPKGLPFAPHAQVPALGQPLPLPTLKAQLANVTALPRPFVQQQLAQYSQQLSHLEPLTQQYHLALQQAKGQASHVHHPLREAHSRYLSARNTLVWQGLFLSSLAGEAATPQAPLLSLLAASPYGSVEGLQHALSTHAQTHRGWAVLGWDALAHHLFVTGVDAPSVSLPQGVVPLVVWDVQAPTLAHLAQHEHLYKEWVWQQPQGQLATVPASFRQATGQAYWQAMPWARLNAWARQVVTQA
jgi:superoxide dismutase